MTSRPSRIGTPEPSSDSAPAPFSSLATLHELKHIVLRGEPVRQEQMRAQE